MEADLFIKVGSGSKTKFWKDIWIEQSSLRDVFPDLFQICENPDANVSDCWTEQGWDLVFRRFLNDWEVERVHCRFTREVRWNEYRHKCQRQDAMER